MNTFIVATAVPNDWTVGVIDNAYLIGFCVAGVILLVVAACLSHRNHKTKPAVTTRYTRHR